MSDDAPSDPATGEHRFTVNVSGLRDPAELGRQIERALRHNKPVKLDASDVILREALRRSQPCDRLVCRIARRLHKH